MFQFRQFHHRERAETQVERQRHKPAPTILVFGPPELDAIGDWAKSKLPDSRAMTEYESSKYEEEEYATLAGAAERLEAALTELAGRLRPFPSFLGMTSVQAVEVNPPLAVNRDLGCVVVDPDGRLCRFDITAISGIAGIAEADQIEEFQPLDLAPLEYIVYASAAIELLAGELSRRGG